MWGRGAKWLAWKSKCLCHCNAIDRPLTARGDIGVRQFRLLVKINIYFILEFHNYLDLFNTLISRTKCIMQVINFKEKNERLAVVLLTFYKIRTTWSSHVVVLQSSSLLNLWCSDVLVAFASWFA